MENLKAGNPNYVKYLWSVGDFESPSWKAIKEEKEMFLSQKCIHQILGILKGEFKSKKPFNSQKISASLFLLNEIIKKYYNSLGLVWEEDWEKEDTAKAMGRIASEKSLENSSLFPPVCSIDTLDALIIKLRMEAI